MLQNYSVKMLRKFNIRFRLRLDRQNNGKAPIQVRVSIGSERKEFDSGMTVRVAEWNSQTGRLRANSDSSINSNTQLIELERHITKVYQTLVGYNPAVTVEDVVRSFKGETSCWNYTLPQAYEYYFRQFSSLIESGQREASTLVHYRSKLRIIQSFCSEHYKSEELPIQFITEKFIFEFHDWLQRKNLKLSYVNKHLKLLKSVMKKAYSLQWTPQLLFQNFKGENEKPKRESLEIDQIRRLCLLEVTAEKLKEICMKYPDLRTTTVDTTVLVLNHFLFMCMTGLRYSDAKKLQRIHIRAVNEDDFVIDIPTQKTGLRQFTPLCNEARKILSKLLPATENDYVMNLETNQAMNRILKVIGALASIDLKLTCHLSRHTFTTIMRDLCVSEESISQMVGHSSKGMTGRYGKPSTKRVLKEFKEVEREFDQIFDQRQSLLKIKVS
jgi:integrase